jgi:ABC-type Fe3+/spermidine/putrescine transport system ATPase subunit
MASPASLELIRVTKRYGSTVAVDAIDLKIPAGTRCAVSPARHDRARGLLTLVAMDTYAERRPAQLSGGQQ